MDKLFFSKPTLDVAKNLLGCKLINGKTSGMIVESEAYLYNDRASHSFKGKTERNKVMFDSPGRAYVYFIYGNHYCFNVVTNKHGIGEAVLLRALELLSGFNIMRKRRKKEELKELCSGPGKLCSALGIEKKHNGKMLNNGSLRIEKFNKIANKNIIKSRRIGISNGSELYHRFYIKGNIFISRK